MVYMKPRVANEGPEPAQLSEDGQIVVIPFALSCIYEITTFKISNLPSDLTSTNSKSLVLKTLTGIIANKTIPLISISSTNPEVIQLKKLIKQCENEKENLNYLSQYLPEYTEKRKMHE